MSSSARDCIVVQKLINTKMEWDASTNTLKMSRHEEPTNIYDFYTSLAPVDPQKYQRDVWTYASVCKDPNHCLVFVVVCVVGDVELF